MAFKIIKKSSSEGWDKKKPFLTAFYTRLSLEKVDELPHTTLNP